MGAVPGHRPVMPPPGFASLQIFRVFSNYSGTIRLVAGRGRAAHPARGQDKANARRIRNGHRGEDPSKAQSWSNRPSEGTNRGLACFFRRSEGKARSEIPRPIEPFRSETRDVRPSVHGRLSPQSAKRSMQDPDLSPQIGDSCGFDRRGQESTSPYTAQTKSRHDRAQRRPSAPWNHSAQPDGRPIGAGAATDTHR